MKEVLHFVVPSVVYFADEIADNLSKTNPLFISVDFGHVAGIKN